MGTAGDKRVVLVLPGCQVGSSPGSCPIDLAVVRGEENITKCRFPSRGGLGTGVSWVQESPDTSGGPASELKGRGKDLPRQGIWHILREIDAESLSELHPLS